MNDAATDELAVADPTYPELHRIIRPPYPTTVFHHIPYQTCGGWRCRTACELEFISPARPAPRETLTGPLCRTCWP